jgi:hypothetical protein
MSYSTLYKVYKTKVTTLKEYRNGWGTAPVIWDYLEAKYLESKTSIWTDAQPLWGLWKDQRVPKSLRMIHLFCMDGAIIRIENITEAAALILEGAKILKAEYPERVNHWADIANDLFSLQGLKDKRLQGIGLNGTSVHDVWNDGDMPKLFDCFDSLKEQP